MLGIMGALHDEIAPLLGALTGASATEIAGRTFHTGNLYGQPAVVVEARLGKVAAAITATHLVATFRVDAVIFTGVAGGVDPSLRVGDVVVARRLFQHDMDASPLYPPLEIPLLGLAGIPADPHLAPWLAQAASRYLLGALRQDVTPAELDAFGIREPRVVEGDVATGDRFFASPGAIAELRTRVPDAVCVEMEGAAVAQVCHEHGVPAGIVRTISDTADHAAAVDFARFTRAIAGRYSRGIVRAFILGEQGGG
jgi:adenosylhomocysteine nucleosidase